MRWALGYALKSPSFELIGVTVTDADTPQRARLACKLLYRLGRTDVPVAVGRQTAAVPPDRVDYQFAWAEDFRGLQADRHAGRRVPGRHHPEEPGSDHARGRRAAPEHRRSRPAPSGRRAVGQARRADERIDWRRTPRVPYAVAEWNVKLAIPEAQAVYAAALAADDRAARLDDATCSSRTRSARRCAGPARRSLSRSKRCCGSGPSGRRAA